MQSSNRDMEFNAWMDFLIKLTCSVYSMDPIEVNFKYGNSGQKGAMQEQSNREKITESKERGLRPLLGHLSSLINRNIIWPLNENFEFCFVGLDSSTRDEAAKLQTQQVKSYRTVDEIRAEEDLEPMPEGEGAVILDPTWLQARAQKAQADQQAQMAQQGYGQPGADGEPPTDENGEPDFEAMLGDDDDEDDEDDENAPPPPRQLQAPGRPPQFAPKPAGAAPPALPPAKPAPFQKSKLQKSKRGRNVRMDFRF
jgi:hypothetical protein